ncbi:MAG: DUF4258 domain-containing protein [Candidatus Marinimicrobia bacterium]|nr:DUF4258 domain-containing protein [Candidatus Neomarinimicrobiota bacterium]
MIDKIKKIKKDIIHKNYRFTLHSLERRIEREISKSEIEEAIKNGEIIEDYTGDKYSPSCLILGYTINGRPLHIQCSVDPVWIITCYDPSEQSNKWNNNYKKRR